MTNKRSSKILSALIALAAITFSLAVNVQAQTEVFLHYFTGTRDGSGPNGRLVFDSAGNLYGTTISGDNGIGFGNVFELSPSSSGWVYTVLHKFTGAPDGDGAGGLVFDAAGNLYGPASGGGTHSSGLAFEIIP